MIFVYKDEVLHLTVYQQWMYCHGSEFHGVALIFVIVLCDAIVLEHVSSVLLNLVIMSGFKDISASGDTGGDSDHISPGIALIGINDIGIVRCISKGAIFLIVLSAYQQEEFNSVSSVSGIY